MNHHTPTGAAELPEALRVPLDSIHADAGYLCGRLLNGSLTQEQVVASIRRRIDAAKLAAQALSAAQAGVPSDAAITIDFKQASELLEMFGGEPGLVTLQHGGERSHSGAGLYAWYSDLPEDGARFLGAEADNEAVPPAAPHPTPSPAPAQPGQEGGEPAGRFMDEADERKSAKEGYEKRIKRVSERNPNDEGMYTLGWWDRAWKAAARAAPQPATADALDAARWRWLSEHIQVAWNEGKFTSLVRVVSEQHRQSLNASVDRMIAGDWRDAARAAQGGQDTMSTKSIAFDIGPFTVGLSAASDFWWLDTQSGGLLGKRRTYLLVGIHPMRYERFNAISVHLLWLRLQIGWLRKGARLKGKP